ncbi:MAG: cupin domain-containing protein [Cyanobacteria bacterium P01_A01_bin.123]
MFCLGADTEISEHTATRNATVQVLEGKGTLTLNQDAIALEPGVLILMPANAPHSLVAATELTFILTLSSTA